MSVRKWVRSWVVESQGRTACSVNKEQRVSTYSDEQSTRRASIKVDFPNKKLGLLKSCIVTLLVTLKIDI